MIAKPPIVLLLTGLLAMGASLSTLVAQPTNPPEAKETDRARAGLDCRIHNQEDFKKVPNCARRIGAGTYTISESALSDLEFRDRYSGGLGHIYIFGKGWAYVRKDGFARRVKFYDNGPDYFEDGLARTEIDGKLGFINQKLEIVVPAKFDGALPFGDGHAVVCSGCSTVQDGEHSHYEGGEWACIDTLGRVKSEDVCGLSAIKR